MSVDRLGESGRSPTLEHQHCVELTGDMVFLGTATIPDTIIPSGTLPQYDSQGNHSLILESQDPGAPGADSRPWDDHLPIIRSTTHDLNDFYFPKFFFGRNSGTLDNVKSEYIYST
jgi:hypothetical protein